MSPVASDADIERFEAWLGGELPPLLARIYREVANGGVGPSGGLIGIPPDGYHVAVLEDWGSVVRDGEMPIVDWGCGGFSTIEVHDPDASVTTSQPGRDGPVVESEHDTLHEFLQAWLEGERLSPFAEVAIASTDAARKPIEF